MRIVTVLAMIIVSLCGVTTTAAAATASAPSPAIIGGATADSAPWGAQVYWDSVGFQCSGTIVAPQWVLTAKHCLDSGGMSVLIGDVHLGHGTKAVVDATKADPDGDLALLHLSQQVDTTYVRLAELDPDVGSTGTIYGWGMTSTDGGRPADTLRTASVRVSAVGCADAFDGPAICSDGLDGAAYHGDSGGPEFSDDGSQVGVCSTGDKHVGQQQYASVAANRDWITSVAGV